MGLKKKSKVSAEFSMSSLTDIIFLLLIFFMLTSSMVIPNALNLRLPGKSKSPQAPSKTEPLNVTIDTNGTYYLNGNSISDGALEKSLRDIKKTRGKDTVVTIKPSKKTPTGKVVYVMDLAYRLGIQAVMNDPK